MLLARTRERGARRLPQSDTDLAVSVIKELRRAQEDMDDGPNGPSAWWALAGLGALALAAAPFTFGSSIPAGLSGAAALTAGLAAFGPGGMAGGIATVAAMTGIGALVAGAGYGMAMAEDDDHARRRRTQRLARNAQEFRRRAMEMPAPNLRELLTTLIAVIRLDASLGGPTVECHYDEAQQVADRMRTELRLHNEFAPGSDAARDWQARLEVMERYVSLLRPAILQSPEALERAIEASAPK